MRVQLLWELWIVVFVCRFSIFVAESAHLKVKLTDAFVNWAKSEVLSASLDAFRQTKDSWSYNKDFDSSMRYTKYGECFVYDYANPRLEIANNQPVISFDYVKLKYTYTLYYHVLYIPINWGTGWNYYRVNDFKIYLKFTPPSLSTDGSMSYSRIDYSDVYSAGSYRYNYNSQGDKYGDDLSISLVFGSFTEELRSKLFSYYSGLKTFERQLNEIYVRKLPKLTLSDPLLTSTDSNSTTSIGKLYDKTRSFFRNVGGSTFWFDILMSDAKTEPQILSSQPPSYAFELLVKDIQRSRAPSSYALKRKTLQRIGASKIALQLMEMFAPLVETIEDVPGISLKYGNLSLGEVRESDRNLYRNLRTEVDVVEVNKEEDFFHDIERHEANFSIIAGDTHQYTQQSITSITLIREVECYLNGSMNDFRPRLQNKVILNVIRYVERLKDAVASEATNEASREVWKISEPPMGYSFTKGSISNWKMKENSIDVEFKTNLKQSAD